MSVSIIRDRAEIRMRGGDGTMETRRFVGILIAVLVPLGAHATPQFARRLDTPCSSCHLVPPALSSEGLAFQASGYLPRGAPATAPAHRPTFPAAAWITLRAEDQGSDRPSELYLPKVELISGGRFADRWSYFVEWRLVSLSLSSDGTLVDRGGRFEDLFVERSLGRRHALRAGQFRSLNQVDVSLRLSPSEPALVNNALPTGEHSDLRLASLDRFSPAARSPGLGYSFRSIAGERAGDGLFHYVTVPYVGELSIPLSPEAEELASFELTGPPKGLFAETFYRRGLRSIGGHAFVAEEGWLATALGTLDWRGLLVTAGVGHDERDGLPSRERGSVQAEWYFVERERLRWAPGVRFEEVSDDGARPALVPYVALSFPGSRYTLLAQIEYREQEGSDALVFDLSALF
jgi:hypothetical protein